MTPSIVNTTVTPQLLCFRNVCQAVSVSQSLFVFKFKIILFVGKAFKFFAHVLICSQSEHTFGILHLEMYESTKEKKLFDTFCLYYDFCILYSYYNFHIIIMRSVSIKRNTKNTN